MRERLITPIALLVLLLAACGSSDAEIGFIGEPAPVPVTAVEAPPDMPAIDVLEPGDRVEALTAARERWVENALDDYSYRAQVFTGSSVTGDGPGGCGAGGAALAVTVVDSQVVTARNEDAACSIDLDDPQRLPLTGEEIFDRALKFAIAGGGVELTTDLHDFPENIAVESEIGYFEFRLIEFVSDAAGPVGGGFNALQNDLEAARVRWTENGVSDYTIETIRACECDIRPISETVVAGEVVEGDGPGGVEGMFDLIQRSIDSQFASVDALFDVDTGAPIRISVDESLEIADDEFTIDVLSLIPAADVELADVVKSLGAQVAAAPDDILTLGDARYCGTDMASFDRDAPGANPIARRCFTHGAASGLPSVLVQVQSTIEGDPIVTVYRVDADGGIVVHTDFSQDAFGPGGWSTFECPADSIRFDDTFGLNYFNVSC